MSRQAPERTHEQQREFDCDAALKVGTPDAVRAWAKEYDVPILSPEDDDLLLVSIHTARSERFPGAMRRASQAWLAANKDRILAEREAR